MIAIDVALWLGLLVLSVGVADLRRCLEDAEEEIVALHERLSGRHE